MKTFSDNTGRSWSVTINVGAVKRVRDAFKPRGFPIISDDDPAPALDDATPCPAPTARS